MRRRDRIVEVGAHHADDGVGRVVERDLFADQLLVARKASAEETFAQDDDVVTRFILTRSEGATEYGFGSEHGEEIRRALHPFDALRLSAIADEIGAAGVRRRDDLERGVVTLDVEIVGNRDRAESRLAVEDRRFVQSREARRVAIRKRIEEHRAHDGEDGRVRADAEREAEDRDCGCAALLAKGSEREAKVLEDGFHRVRKGSRATAEARRRRETRRKLSGKS